MKPESLHALLIDREMGELSREMVELLEAWVAEHPDSALTADSIHRTLETMSGAIRVFPELCQPETPVIAFPAFRSRLIPIALAASVLLLIGATAWVGFRAGREYGQQPVAGSHRELSTPPANTVRPDGPWARYALASDPRGGLTVMRRNTNPQP